MRPSGPLASCAAHASNGHYRPPRFRVRGTIRWLSARMRRGLRRSYAQLYCWLCEKMLPYGRKERCAWFFHPWLRFLDCVRWRSCPQDGDLPKSRCGSFSVSDDDDNNNSNDSDYCCRLISFCQASSCCIISLVFPLSLTGRFFHFSSLVILYTFFIVHSFCFCSLVFLFNFLHWSSFQFSLLVFLSNILYRSSFQFSCWSFSTFLH